MLTKLQWYVHWVYQRLGMPCNTTLFEWSIGIVLMLAMFILFW